MRSSPSYLVLCIVLTILPLCTGQCDFLKHNCQFPTGQSKGTITCYLEGSPTEPGLDEILSQSYSTTTQVGCPVINSHGYPFVVFLEPCKENIEINKGSNLKTKVRALSGLTLKSFL